MILLLRLTGGSLVGLGLLHAVLWRTFGWGAAIRALSPINGRVFVVHAGFIVYVLVAMGLLSLLRPDLLLAPSDLARLLLGATVAFWAARLLCQAFVFDQAMRSGWTGTPLVRAGAFLLWSGYVAIYGLALARQLGAP